MKLYISSKDQKLIFYIMKLKTKLSADWKSWIQSNLERGVKNLYF